MFKQWEKIPESSQWESNLNDLKDADWIFYDQAALALVTEGPVIAGLVQHNLPAHGRLCNEFDPSLEHSDFFLLKTISLFIHLKVQPAIIFIKLEVKYFTI